MICKTISVQPVWYSVLFVDSGTAASCLKVQQMALVNDYVESPQLSK